MANGLIPNIEEVDQVQAAPVTTGLLEAQEIQRPFFDATSPPLPTAPGAELVIPTVKPAREFITPEATVAGQLETLLTAGSPLLTLAEKRSKEQAQRAGLLSSSLAVGAGQRAITEAALPIAQQDARTFAQAGLTELGAAQQERLTGLQGQISSRLQREQALQQAGLSEQESAQRIALENIAQTAQTSRLAQELQSKLDIADKQVLGQNKDVFAEATGKVFQQFQSEFSKIQTTSDSILDAAEKNKLINQLQTQVQNQVDVLSSLYSIPIEWD